MGAENVPEGPREKVAGAAWNRKGSSMTKSER